MNEKNQDKTWEQAAAKVHNETNEAEANELDIIAQHAESRRIYGSVNEIHEKLSETHPLRHSSAYRSWGRVNRYFKRKKIRLCLNISKYAAIILLAVGVGTLINFHWKPPAPEALPMYSEVHVPLGQMSEMTLPDGTHVWLNSGTTLQYPDNFGKKHRDVHLNGEALFKVQKGDTPFKVKLKNSEVEVLGTTFAILSYSEDTYSQITLVEGSVQVNDVLGRELTRIHPEQQIYIPDDIQKNAFVKEVRTRFYESWAEGKIIFDDERLADVTRRLERWYNVEIQFDRKETGELRFSGTILKNKPFDQIVKAFSLLLPVKIDYQNNIENKDVITISIK